MAATGTYGTYDNSINHYGQNEIALDSLPLRMRANIVKIDAGRTETHRLLEIGLTTGAEIRAMFRSLGGNLTAYEICGAVFALRKNLAKNITVRLENL
ncbi:MAG: ferrous iron transport protein A [Firmicutes bacterium]|nr:ferrous iron transport protein A [Bacillota bacterium]